MVKGKGRYMEDRKWEEEMVRRNEKEEGGEEMAEILEKDGIKMKRRR